MKTLRVCNDRQEWDDYILDNGGHPLQLWGWGELKSANGWSADRLFLVDQDNNIFGAVQVLYKKIIFPFRSLAYVPRGPVASEPNREELLSLLAIYIKKSRHSVSLMIEPDTDDFTLPKGWLKSSEHILPANTIILDLNKTETDLLADMAKKTRQYIRKSSSSGLVIKTVSNIKDLNDCLFIYKETAKRSKFSLHKEKYYYDVFHKFKDNSRIFAVYDQDKPIAFLWLALSTNTAYELYGGMNNIGHDLRANYALKWHAISKCKEWGLDRYDFGGLIEGGVSTFKKGWSRAEAELVGTYVLPTSASYGLWAKALPLGRSGLRKIKSLLSQR